MVVLLAFGVDRRATLQDSVENRQKGEKIQEAEVHRETG
jgi:hypothetical protein